MSATPTRVDWEAPLADAPPPLAEGNRVLESIGRQEGLRALLAFSDLHEQIQERRPTTGPSSDWDLFQTERFVLDEVLQLICDRVQVLTQADGILVALADGSEMVCRASAGPLAIRRNVHLNTESAFLRECLESRRILRCDDSETDGRTALDIARQVAARATVLVPLRGREERVGVLQAFSAAPWSFTDHDVRCFDLFAELVLTALRPKDQDRRFHWLSDVAGELLHAQPAAKPEFAALAQPVVIPVAAVEICDQESAADHKTERHAVVTQQEVAEQKAAEELAEETEAAVEEALPETLPTVLPWHPISVPASSRPGLSVVLGLVAVAALFSVGVWWGTQVPGKTSTGRAVATTTLPPTPSATTSGASTTAPGMSATGSSSPAPGVSPASDNLLEPAAAASETALVPIPENKLAALPKITGVRHWSSSMGSTVVIDMQDQVPYEVHRLMSPERIYFDLHDTALASDLNGKTMDVGDASLTKVRVAQPVAGVTRIVLDTKDGSNFSVSMESNPYRLVIELRDSVKSFATNHPAPPAPAAKPAPAPVLAATTTARPLPAKTGKFRIVLDPGHGGWDLGTVGRQGLLEKDLVLDVTQRLGKLLRARLGSEVMFTRNGDDYLPLDQRADFANHAQADLFVSVHANYSTLAKARGVETYYTNLFSAPGSKEVAKHADGTFAQLTPVSLSAGGLHEKTEESRHLAASVQRSLYATLAAKSPDIRDRGIKDASFAVLTGTTMPAILTEISFVSSPADEQNLQSETYRQQIAEALYKGIARYEESSPHAKVAKLMPGATGR